MTESRDGNRGGGDDALPPDEMIDSTWKALALYFTGQASPEDVAKIGHADPKLFRRAQKVWDATGVVATSASEPTSSIDAAWKREIARLDTEANDVGDTTPTPKQERVLRLSSASRTPRQGSKVWFMLAAAAVVVFAIGVGRSLVNRSGVDQKAPVSIPGPRVYATQRAQRAQVRLGDGSSVTLAPESRLEVPPDFGTPKGSRVVTLIGQAYFDVVHDTTQPFTVRSGNAVVRDIGTRFDVRAYGDVAERDLKVVVAEGAVVLKAVAAKDTLLLRTADAGELTKAGALRVQRGVDVAGRLAWLEGRLEFIDVPLHQVVQDLMRWYDVEIVVPDAALSQYLITTNVAYERAGDALNAIARVIDARVERRGAHYAIVRNNSKSDTITPR